MPYVTNGNIYAPVMMVAEKAADLILGNQPLPPAVVPFYRHQPKQQASDQEQSPAPHSGDVLVVAPAARVGAGERHRRGEPRIRSAAFATIITGASVMPYVTNGNIYAPVMMVAEKAADLILGNQPLPPAAVPFYRHQPKQQASDQETVPGG